MIRRILAVAILLTLVACGGRDSTRGVVIEVEGDLTEVTGFLLRLPDGSDLRLRPAAGILFHDDAPLSHLRDHLRSGEPVEVEYEVLENGTAVAYRIGD